MKAVVVERPRQVAYREVDAPSVGPDEVLVRNRAAGLCRTDIEMMTGAFSDPRWVHFPVIPGHEWAGTAVEVGANVKSVRVVGLLADKVLDLDRIVTHRFPA